MADDDQAAVELGPAWKALFAKASNQACPFCRNRNWFHMPKGDSVASGAFDVYTLSCTNCGFIRQHVKDVVNGVISGEVDFAGP